MKPEALFTPPLVAAAAKLCKLLYPSQLVTGVSFSMPSLAVTPGDAVTS